MFQHSWFYNLFLHFMFFLSEVFATEGKCGNLEDFSPCWFGDTCGHRWLQVNTVSFYRSHKKNCHFNWRSATIICFFPSFCEQLWSDFMLHTAWVCEQQDAEKRAGFTNSFFSRGHQDSELLPTFLLTYIVCCCLLIYLSDVSSFGFCRKHHSLSRDKLHQPWLAG